MPHLGPCWKGDETGLIVTYTHTSQESAVASFQISHASDHMARHVMKNSIRHNGIILFWVLKTTEILDVLILKESEENKVSGGVSE